MRHTLHVAGTLSNQETKSSVRVTDVGEKQLFCSQFFTEFPQVKVTNELLSGHVAVTNLILISSEYRK